MRLKTMTKMLVVGGGVAAVVLGARRIRQRGGSARAADFVEEPVDLTDAIVDVPDPRDPVQSLDEVHELHVEDLEVDAASQADIEAARDLDALDFADTSLDDDLATAAGVTGVGKARRGSGELYGVHVPHAVDRDLVGGEQTLDNGENWVEALQESAVEYGSDPEEVLDFAEDAELDPVPTDGRDVPIADRGSAGPRGL